VLKTRDLFNRMSGVVDRIKGLQALAADRAKGLPEADPLRKQLEGLIDKAQDQRKLIVATREGGAITGEIRIRENTDDVYGALMSYEGAPAPYQLERVAALTRELDDVQTAVDGIEHKDLAPINAALAKKGLQPITPDAMRQAALELMPNPFDPDATAMAAAMATMTDRDAR